MYTHGNCNVWPWWLVLILVMIEQLIILFSWLMMVLPLKMIRKMVRVKRKQSIKDFRLRLQPQSKLSRFNKYPVRTIGTQTFFHHHILSYHHPDPNDHIYQNICAKQFSAHSHYHPVWLYWDHFILIITRESRGGLQKKARFRSLWPSLRESGFHGKVRTVNVYTTINANIQSFSSRCWPGRWERK